ncbi:class I SAM-dependent methyltransferase [Aurantivibrio plasticivorans]
MEAQDPPVLLERIYPKEMDMSDSNDRESLAIHEARYEFASSHLTGKSILDMACGCGFGTAQMAGRHPELRFTGVDIDPEAIDYARRNYQLDNLEFICTDAMRFDQDRYDTIVSLETIEHLIDPRAFIANLPSLLNAGGAIIASVPITPTCDGNPHHLHDFSLRSFNKLFSNINYSPKQIFKQTQPWVYKDAFSEDQQSTSRSQGVGNNVLAYYRKHPLALLTRIYSILRHGTCNIYATQVFTQNT